MKWNSEFEGQIDYGIYGAKENYMNKIEFREIYATDINFLSALLSDEIITSSLHTNPILYSELTDIYEKYWANDKDEKHFIIWRDNQRIGWLKVNGLSGKDKAWISMLVISADYQNQGIGTAAVKFAEDFIKDNGFVSVGIQTTIDNKKAVSLYEKCGYKVIKNNIFNAENGYKYDAYSFEKLL